MTQFAETNFSKEIGFFGDQVQELENAVFDIYNLRDLDVATGETLDYIGGLVGQPRPAGMIGDDVAYLALIRGKIQINSSSGEPDRLINALWFYISDTAQASQVHYDEIAPNVIWISFIPAVGTTMGRAQPNPRLYGLIRGSRSMNRGPADMDPNATLIQLRLLAVEIDSLMDLNTDEELGFDPDTDERMAQIAAEMSGYFQALDGWILHGGFLPSDWHETQHGRAS